MARRGTKKPNRDTALPRAPRPEMRHVWFWRWTLTAAGLFLFFGTPIYIPIATLTNETIEALILIPTLIAGVSILAATIAFLWSHLFHARYSFEIREEDVVVQRGVIFRTRTLIPLRRVQDILVQSGPLLRTWGLSTVKLETAGSGYHSRSWGEGQIPGIRNGEQIAELLLARVKNLRDGM